MVDDNFLVDLDRARHIAEGLVRAGADFKWSIQATTNLTARLTHEDLKLLRRSGLHQICQGVDSGSEKILKLMNKTFQDFDSIYESASRCLHAESVLPSTSFSPTRRRQERTPRNHRFHDGCVPAVSRRRILDQHFHALSWLAHHGAGEGTGNSRCRPRWKDGRIFFRAIRVLPWLSGREHKRLQVMRDYLRIAFDRVPIAADTRKRSTRIAQKLLSFPARWRLDHDVYRAASGTVDQRKIET